LEVPRDIYYKKELDLRLSMSYGPGRYDVEYEERGHDYPFAYVRWTEQRNMAAFLDLTAAGQVNVSSLVSHRFPFNKALSVYEMITGGREGTLGVVLEYDAGDQPRRIAFREDIAESATGTLNLGVIGAGGFAKGVLLPRLKSRTDARLRGVVTGRGVTAKAVGEKFEFAYCAEDIDEVLLDPETNAVLIATRHNMHGPLVKRALEAGKHVFVEKPLCISEEELREIIVAHSSGIPGRLVMVGFNRRFSSFALRVRDIVADRSNPLVASYRINAGFIGKESWIQDPAEGGGRIVGEVCHFVDTLRFLVGAPVESVQAASIRTSDARQTNRDSVSITIAYEDGSLANIVYYALGNKDYPKEKVEIACDGRNVVLDDYTSLEVFAKKKTRVNSKQDKGFDGEIDSFLGAVLKGGPAPIPFGDLVETTLVTFAVGEALNTRETVFLKEKYSDIL
jgi:polar amino acid transport system substrate-binding protein